MADSRHGDVLDHLKAGREGWTAPIPAHYGTFLGRPLTLDLTTYDYMAMPPHAGTAPQPTAEELEFAAQILDRLPDVLAEAERRFGDYSVNGADDPDAALHVASPQVWISRVTRALDGASRWTLVVERDDAPDFGCHLEFDGLACVGVQAGD